MTNEFSYDQFWLMVAIAALTAVVVAVEHVTFGRIWKRNEMARRIMGHATILAVVGVFVVLGRLDVMTWLAFVVATGVAGALIGAVVVSQQERRKSVYLQQLRTWADEQTGEADHGAHSEQ